MYGVWRWVIAALLTLTAAACSSDGDAAEVPGATVPTEAATSTTLSVEQEVEQAYLKAFDIYVDALRRLDASRLPEAFTGEALALYTQEVADLKAANTPVRYEVEHDYDVSVNGEAAEVVDNYVNHSVLLDGSTGQPLEPDPNQRLEYRFVLERREGKWLVVDVFKRS